MTLNVKKMRKRRHTLMLSTKRWTLTPNLKRNHPSLLKFHPNPSKVGPFDGECLEGRDPGLPGIRQSQI